MSKLKGRAPELVCPGKLKGMIYGPTGVGKTWLTMSFPRPYYFDCEGGGDLRHYQQRLKEAGGAYLGPEDGTLDFNFLIDQMQALATEKHEFKTLIFDSITKVYQTAIANEAERLGDKDAFGASKKPAIAQMRRMVNWAMRLDVNIWFVAHEASEWGIDEKTGQRIEKGKCPDVWEKLQYELDLVLWAQKRGQSRVAIVRKSRLIGFPDQDVFPLEYAELAQRYGKDYIESEAQTLTLATTEQLAEITRLLGAVKVSEAEISKIWNKAGVDSWAEMSTDHAAKTINWLNNKLK